MEAAATSSPIGCKAGASSRRQGKAIGAKRSGAASTSSTSWPGLRYVNALQAAVFGESNFASWVGILLVPGLVYLLLRGLIPAAPAAASTILFSLLVMSSRYHYELHVDHLAESVGYPMALGGVLLGVAALRNREYSGPLDAAARPPGSLPPRPFCGPICFRRADCSS